ncbi:hypothetical protein OZ811_000489 [Yersinia enterocolitica]
MEQMHENDKRNINNVTTTMLQGLNYLWEWRWSLKAISFVLFIDSVLIFFNGNGFLSISLNPFDLFGKAGFWVVAIVSCSLIFSIFLPALFWSIQLAIISFAPKLINPEIKAQKCGYVSSSELRDYAIINHNEFLLKICDEYDRLHLKVKEERREIANLLASVLFLCVVNYFISSPQYLSLIENLIGFLGVWGKTIIGLTVLIFSAMLYSLWFVEWPDDGIKYPPLWNEKNKHFFVPPDEM